MPNIKEINWDTIRADYVLGTDYPTFDELAKRHNVNKPLIISKANDLNDPINRGKSWVQQRQDYIAKKQNVQQDVAINEAKKAVGNFVKMLNNVGMRSFKLISKELEQLEKDQKDALDNGKPFSVRKFVKISDLTKMAAVLYKLSGSESKELLVKLEFAGRESDKRNISLQDLSDEQLADLDRQVATGGAKMIESDEDREEE